MDEIILSELAEIKRNTLLAAKQVLTSEDVCALTGLSRGTLYQMTCRHEIPYSKPNGKTIYFRREDVEAWMKKNPVSAGSPKGGGN